MYACVNPPTSLFSILSIYVPCCQEYTVGDCQWDMGLPSPTYALIPRYVRTWNRIFLVHVII